MQITVLPRQVPLSIWDRMSLSDSKEDLAQRYYDTTRALAERCQIDGFEYHPTPGLSNLDEVGKLWMLQARQGSWTNTLASIPATALTGAAGVLGGTPIEGVTVRQGKVTGATATGHGFNPMLNAASALSLALGVSGAAGQFSPILMALGAVGPLLTVAPLVLQSTSDLNAPVHEMAHAMQFLVLGDLVNQKILEPTDLVAIQNDQGRTGYLWGGETEEAAHQAESTGDPSKIFAVLRKRCREHLSERYPHSKDRLQKATSILNKHEKWVTEQLKR